MSAFFCVYFEEGYIFRFLLLFVVGMSFKWIDKNEEG